MMIVMLMAILVPSTPWPFPVLKNTKPGFSERCSSILNMAYSGDKRIGTWLAAAGISADSCSLNDGTAASSSIGTGIVALMLEVNPSLSC